jgi:hypothetical protein
MYFNKPDITVLLRALHDNTEEKRATWFDEVRACRRRLQISWKGTFVDPVLSMRDEYQLKKNIYKQKNNKNKNKNKNKNNKQKKTFYKCE